MDAAMAAIGVEAGVCSPLEKLAGLRGWSFPVRHGTSGHRSRVVKHGVKEVLPQFSNGLKRNAMAEFSSTCDECNYAVATREFLLFTDCRSDKHPDGSVPLPLGPCPDTMSLPRRPFKS